MSEVIALPGISIPWDEEHVRYLLSEPEYLLAREPWSSWVRQQGGLPAVYASLRSLPLPEKHRRTLASLLNEPGASLQQYALVLHVSVATYVRYRAALLKTLVTVLNAQSVEKVALAPESVPPPSRPKTNLPHQRMPLIGREKELETAARLLLSEQTNLLTISGPGGIGKTRLAQQLATTLLPDFRDGVFFVSLAAITNPDLVAATIAQALGLKSGESGPIGEVLQGYLQDKRILLVMDNFEQVMAAAPLLNELLAAAPELKILVTSRAVLHLYGECEFTLPPLAIPDLKHLPPPQVLAQSPAVALFLLRAQAVKSDLVLTCENAPTVAEICVQLEGIPLALELAAARIKWFSPQALLKGLNCRLALCAQRDTRPARHQTLRDALAWSYHLLEPGEQALFAQLGVFVGGCRLEAVQAVCRLERAGARPTLDHLTALADKSMLQHEIGDEGEPRFRMLETLREYALEQLAAQGEMDTLQCRHAACYVEWVECIEPGPREPNLPAWMRRLEEEHDNLRAALHWALTRGEIEVALRIAGAVWRFWQIHGHAEEGWNWLSTILERSAGAEISPRAKALWGAGWLGMVLGKLDAAQQYFEEGVSISRHIGHKRYLGLSLHGIGALARAQGDFECSRQAFEESLPLFQSLGTAEDVAWTFEHLGATALEQADFDRAVLYLSQGLALFQGLEQRWPCGEALTFLGHAALQQGNYARAQEQYEAALRIYQEQEDRLNIATIHSYIGATLFGRGETEKAIRLYRENLLVSREMKDYWSLAWGIERLAEAAQRLGHNERAGRLWGAADALRHRTGVPWHPGFYSNYTEQRFASLREALGERQWQEMWSAGHRWTLDQAVEYALETAKT